MVVLFNKKNWTFPQTWRAPPRTKNNCRRSAISNFFLIFGRRCSCSIYGAVCGKTWKAIRESACFVSHKHPAESHRYKKLCLTAPPLIRAAVWDRCVYVNVGRVHNEWMKPHFIIGHLSYIGLFFKHNFENGLSPVIYSERRWINQYCLIGYL